MKNCADEVVPCTPRRENQSDMNGTELVDVVGELRARDTETPEQVDPRRVVNAGGE